MASSAATPTATTAAIATAISASVSASVIATAIALARAVATGARWIVLCGIVVGRKILRRGCVGFRLALLRSLVVSQILCYWLTLCAVFLVVLALRGMRFLVRGMILDVGLFGMELFAMCFIVMLAGACQRFARQNINRSALDGRHRRRRGVHGRLLVRMPMVVVLQVFENITNVEEGVAVETNIHESRLHAGKDAGDFSFVDAADEGEFFFALDVDFD